MGLVAALDLAHKGHRSVVIDASSNLSDGSKAICWAKRTLEIMDRLGLGEALVDKGVTWKNGRVFFDEREVFAFDLLPEEGHRMAGLHQPAAVPTSSTAASRRRPRPASSTALAGGGDGLEQTGDGALLTVATPEGAYRSRADWVIAADGARSTMRRLMGLDFEGRVFQDQFLICDIKMKMERPAERWFWFDPPFNRGRSALLHKQADDVWRLDFQVGDQADRDEEMKPENVAKRVRAMLGEDVEFTFEWISLYRFQSRRLKQFRHGRVLFAGDAAHQMSPFGARGGNSGVQDADNLAWKLDLVLRGLAPDRAARQLSPGARASRRREPAAHHASTDFIAPKSEISRVFRDAPWRWPRPSRSHGG